MIKESFTTYFDDENCNVTNYLNLFGKRKYLKTIRCLKLLVFNDQRVQEKKDRTPIHKRKYNRRGNRKKYVK